MMFKHFFFYRTVFILLHSSYVIRKLFFGVSDQVLQKWPVQLQKLDISNLNLVEFTICVAKTKALISCAVTAHLIWAFVLEFAKILFILDAAHLGLHITHFSYPEKIHEQINKLQIHYTPQPLYNTIVGVQANFHVSYSIRVITRVKCIYR